jgi:hypothetical protein
MPDIRAPFARRRPRYRGAMAADPSIHRPAGARTKIRVPQERAIGNTDLSAASTDRICQGLGNGRYLRKTDLKSPSNRNSRHPFKSKSAQLIRL